jgi:hypothetical protein
MSLKIFKDHRGERAETVQLISNDLITLPESHTPLTLVSSVRYAIPLRTVSQDKKETCLSCIFCKSSTFFEMARYKGAGTSLVCVDFSPEYLDNFTTNE